MMSCLSGDAASKVAGGQEKSRSTAGRPGCGLHDGDTLGFAPLLVGRGADALFLLVEPRQLLVDGAGEVMLETRDQLVLDLRHQPLALILEASLDVGVELLLELRAESGLDHL